MRIHTCFRAAAGRAPARAQLRLWLAIGLLLTICTSSGRAHAQTPAQTLAQTADEAFQRGMQALQAGDNQAAVEAFGAARRLAHTPAAALNLGIAYTNLGQLNAAVAALETYTREADQSHDAQNIAAVHAELARLRAENAVIVLATVPAAVSVEVDGQAVMPRAGELIVRPGRRHFRLHAAGYVPYEQTLAVPAGHFMLELKLRPLSVAEPSPGPAPPSAAAPSAPPAAELASSEPEAAKPASRCLFGDLCLGPVLSLGLPNALGGGVHLRIGRYLGAGIDYQADPTLHLGVVAASASLVTAEGRLYPFGGSFFVAAGFGYQRVVGRASQDQQAIEARVGIPTFKVGLGFMGHDGLVVGIDLGFLAPLAGTDIQLSMTATPPAGSGISQAQLDANVARLQGDARKAVRDVVHLLPFLAQLNLLRIGYLF